MKALLVALRLRVMHRVFEGWGMRERYTLADQLLVMSCQYVQRGRTSRLVWGE